MTLGLGKIMISCRVCDATSTTGEEILESGSVLWSSMYQHSCGPIMRQRDGIKHI
jgi:hypothetical protein